MAQAIPLFLNFHNLDIISYHNVQDVDTDAFEIVDDGFTLQLTGNTWKAIDLPYNVQPETVLEFDYLSEGVEPEIAAIGVDANLIPSSSEYWRVYGTQSAGISSHDTYTTWLDSFRDPNRANVHRLHQLSDDD